MKTYIERHETFLKHRNYIQLACTGTHWFNFYAKKLRKEYIDWYGEDFCLVINCSQVHDDAYVLPYKEVKHCFLAQYLRGNRWNGNVIMDNLRVSVDNHVMETVYIAEFRNAFELLKDAPEPIPAKQAKLEFSRDALMRMFE